MQKKCSCITGKTFGLQIIYLERKPIWCHLKHPDSAWMEKYQWIWRIVVAMNIIPNVEMVSVWSCLDVEGHLAHDASALLLPSVETLSLYWQAGCVTTSQWQSCAGSMGGKAHTELYSKQVVQRFQSRVLKAQESVFWFLNPYLKMLQDFLLKLHMEFVYFECSLLL